MTELMYEERKGNDISACGIVALLTQTLFTFTDLISSRSVKILQQSISPLRVSLAGALPCIEEPSSSLLLV